MKKTKIKINYKKGRMLKKIKAIDKLNGHKTTPEQIKMITDFDDMCYNFLIKDRKINLKNNYI